MSEAPSRAKEHSAEDWERIRPRFCDLYFVQNRPLPEVRFMLKQTENFDASEKQYKNKIKLWNLRKNATPGEYALLKGLMQSQSPKPLGDVLTSLKIPISDRKIRRFLMNQGKDVPATIKDEILTPTHRAGGPSAMPLQPEDEEAHSWSPSIVSANEKKPELDQLHMSSSLVELCNELTEKVDQMGQLELQRQVTELQRQATERQIAAIKRLIHSKTAIPELRQKDSAASQSSPHWESHASPRQSTQPQHSHFIRDDFSDFKLFSPGPWEHNEDDDTASLSTVPLNSQEQSPNLFAPQPYDLVPNFGSMAANTAIGGNSLFGNQGYPSGDDWITSPMPAPTPRRMIPTPGLGLPAYAGEEVVSQRATMSSRAAASRCSSAYQKPYSGE